MTQKEMYTLVPQKLKQIEEEYGIRVLYATESGSRAWGTCAEDSDFDIRFIYTRPIREYLRLDQTRDVLEFAITDSWDMAGWDLSKTLQLLYSSNSQIYEWFSSPVVYVDAGFSQRFAPVLKECFRFKTAAKHYLHQAALKRKQVRMTDRPKIKRYLYILQHLASTRWVLDRHSPVPLDFPTLLELLPEQIRAEAYRLLAEKTAAHLALTDRIQWLDEWIDTEFDRLDQEIRDLPKAPDTDWDQLNRFFWSELSVP